MKTTDKQSVNNSIKNLREGIKNKYRHYHQKDRDRFPDFEYNTNRANYKPLRASFEEDLFVIQRIDSTTNTIHIPSINTLALLFTDDNYVPGKKLLDTCWLYAEGKVETIVNQSAPTPGLPEKSTTKKTQKLFAGGFALLICAVILLVVSQRLFVPAASGLVITRPAQKSAVPQEVVVEGNVSNAKTVWLAVRYEKGLQYWIQHPVKVQDNGIWIGVIYIGGVSNEYIGLPFQIRAFVNPAKELKKGEIHYSWPEAELSSEIVEVVRK